METNNIYGLIKVCLINNKTEQVLRARKKLMVLLRDNFQCVNCSSSLDLTIEHKEKLEKIDGSHPLKNYDLDKCITLCAWCHTAKNGDELGANNIKEEKD